MIKITSEEFSKSFFYIGAGFDFQPLMRFTHLCDTFIFTSLYTNKNDVLIALISFANKNKNINIESIEIDDFYNESYHLELKKDYDSDKKSLWGIFTDKQKSLYNEAFVSTVTHDKWIIKIKLSRTGCLLRDLTLYYMSAEGIEAYVLLTQNGRYPPRILCTIQAGILELPNDLMSEIFKHTRSSPEIWIRGFEPLYQYDSSKDPSSKALDIDLFFKFIGSDFLFDWDVQTSNNYYGKRYCKAFISESFFHGKNLNCDIYFNDRNNALHVTGIENSLKFIDVTKKHLFLVTERTRKKVPYSNYNREIITWDSIFRFRQLVSMNDSVNYLKIIDKENLYDEVHFIPYGLDDEGDFLKYFLESKTNISFHAYVYRPLDLIDLRT